MRLRTSCDSVRYRRKWIQQSDSGIGLALTLPWCPAVIPLPLASGKVSGKLSEIAECGKFGLWRQFEFNWRIVGHRFTRRLQDRHQSQNALWYWPLPYLNILDMIGAWRDAGFRNGLSGSRKKLQLTWEVLSGPSFCIPCQTSFHMRIELTCFKCFYFSIDLGLPWEQPRFKSAFAEEHCCDAHRHRNSRRLAYHLQDIQVYQTRTDGLPTVTLQPLEF